MIVYKLLEKYDELFGLKRTFKENLEKSRILKLLYFFYIIVVIWFVVSLLNTKWVQSIISLILILAFIFISQLLSERSLKKRYKSIYAYHKAKQEIFRKFIEEECGLSEDSHQDVLLKVIDNEIEQYKLTKEMPLKNIATQFITALIITGLLTTSFGLLKDGNGEQAVLLLTLYILLIGITIIIGGAIYTIRGFTKQAKLAELKTVIFHIRLNKLVKEKIFEGE